jgi:hypothetical protein
VHRYTPDAERLARALADDCLDRLAKMHPLNRPASPERLEAAAGPTVVPHGLGADEALRLWADVLGPACLNIDHPRYLSFIPGAPSKAAAAFDMLVGASNVYAGSWLEGSGAVYAENQALRWIADLDGRQPVRSRSRPGSGPRAAQLPSSAPLGGLRHRGDPLIGQTRPARGDGR